MPCSVVSDSLDDQEWNNVGCTGDQDCVKIEDGDEAMGVESAEKKNMKTDAMVLDVDGEADHGEAPEEVVAPKEPDVVPPLALPSASGEAPTPPPGQNFPPEGPPPWFGGAVFEASSAAFNTSFHHALSTPSFEQAFRYALKRHQESIGGSVGAWSNDYNKKNKMGCARKSPESSSQSSSWRSCHCYGKFTEFETKEWKDSWELSLKSPTELRDGPMNWNKSITSVLYNATLKAVAEGSREMPNYDSGTISLVTSKLEKVLYDPENWQDQYRFLLIWKTPKYITLACQYCRKMSSLEYSTLHSRDGRKLHWFFDLHLGGGIGDHGKR